MLGTISNVREPRFNAKDIDIIGQLARSAGLQLPAFAVAARQLSRLIDSGDGDLDNAAIIKLPEPAPAGEPDELAVV